MLEPIINLINWKSLYPVGLLVFFWIWECWFPLFRWSQSKTRHAIHNLLIAFLNSAVLAITFSSITTLTVHFSAEQSLGLFHLTPLPFAVELIVGLILLDGWMYFWHRLNHAVPLLWRFHRMHHSDTQMDVTSATRFHLGEHLISATFRLGLILLLGLSLWHLIIYHALMVFTTQLHHANISLGQFDSSLRWLIVTPNMHKVHHSCEQAETNSNYSVVLSIWDHLGRSFNQRDQVETIEFGLKEYQQPKWQTVWGMLKTPWNKGE